MKYIILSANLATKSDILIFVSRSSSLFLPRYNTSSGAAQSDEIFTQISLAGDSFNHKTWKASIG